MEHSRKMVMVPLEEVKRKKTKYQPMKPEFYEIVLKLAQSAAFNKNGEIKSSGKTFIKGSDLYELICFTIGRRKEEPKHLLAFEKLLGEHGFGPEKVKNKKIKKELAVNKGIKAASVVNEKQNYSDSDTISWYSTAEDD